MDAENNNKRKGSEKGGRIRFLRQPFRVGGWTISRYLLGMVGRRLEKKQIAIVRYADCGSRRDLAKAPLDNVQEVLLILEKCPGVTCAPNPWEEEQT